MHDFLLLIFSCSQSAFSRGGQTLFLDFNVHTGVPSYMRDTEAIGPSGKHLADLIIVRIDRLLAQNDKVYSLLIT